MSFKPKTAKDIKRNVLRFMGFDLPNEWLDSAHEIRFGRDKDDNYTLLFKVKAEMQMKDWRVFYGGSRD